MLSSSGTRIGEAHLSCTLVTVVKTVAYRVQVQVDKLLGYDKRVIRNLSECRTINLTSTFVNLNRLSGEVSVS